MYKIGEKIIYSENGVCTVVEVGPISMGGADKERIYYTLSPMMGTGTFYAPVDSKVFMRPVMTKAEAEEFVNGMKEIEPAICKDVRFTHVDAFYKELFKKHSCEALVAMLKGIYSQERVNRSNRIDSVTKRAKEILHCELSVALGIPMEDMEEFITQRIN